MLTEFIQCKKVADVNCLPKVPPVRQSLLMFICCPGFEELGGGGEGGREGSERKERRGKSYHIFFRIFVLKTSFKTEKPDAVALTATYSLDPKRGQAISSRPCGFCSVSTPILDQERPGGNAAI